MPRNRCGAVAPCGSGILRLRRVGATGRYGERAGVRPYPRRPAPNEPHIRRSAQSVLPATPTPAGDSVLADRAAAGSMTPSGWMRAIVPGWAMDGRM